MNAKKGELKVVLIMYTFIRSRSIIQFSIPENKTILAGTWKLF
jgi:hypothetical protein